MWNRDPWHWLSDGGQDSNWHLLWGDHHIVSWILEEAEFSVVPVYGSFVKGLPVLSNNVGPGFQLRVELYSSSGVEDFTLGALVPRRLSFLGGSLGCSSGRKIRAAFDTAAACGSASVGGETRPGRVSLPLSLDQSALWAWQLLYGAIPRLTTEGQQIYEVPLVSGSFSHSAELKAPMWSEVVLPHSGFKIAMSVCCFLSEGVPSTACWLTQLWASNTSRTVSRHTTWLFQKQVTLLSPHFYFFLISSLLYAFLYLYISFLLASCKLLQIRWSRDDIENRDAEGTCHYLFISRHSTRCFFYVSLCQLQFLC